MTIRRKVIPLWPSRHAILLHHTAIGLVAEARSLRYGDVAFGIGVDTATPQAGRPLHVEGFDGAFAADRHQMQRGEIAGTVIWRVRDDLDAELVSRRRDLQEFGD